MSALNAAYTLYLHKISLRISSYLSTRKIVICYWNCSSAANVNYINKYLNLFKSMESQIVNNGSNRTTNSGLSFFPKSEQIKPTSLKQFLIASLAVPCVI
jgi:hypothetical protein